MKIFVVVLVAAVVAPLWVTAPSPGDTSLSTCCNLLDDPMFCDPTASASANNGGRPPFVVESGRRYCHLSKVTGELCLSGADCVCVTDGTSRYGNDEECSIRATRGIVVSSVFFETESGYDDITMSGTRCDGLYSGSTGPMNCNMPAGSRMSWNTDGSEVRAGFIICASGGRRRDGGGVFRG